VTDERVRGPGRPRSERSRQAILASALALAAEEGPAGLRMDAIARRAGVSKETLYRWWPSKTEVILDALAEQGLRTIPLPDAGTLRGDLRGFLRATVDSLDPPTIRVLQSLAAQAAADTGTALQIRDRFLATRRAQLSQLLRRGEERGEIDQDKAGLALDLIYGSLWYRLIFLVGPLDYPWADGVADLITDR
jgi:AcrR family transcriptional regulator